MSTRSVRPRDAPAIRGRAPLRTYRHDRGPHEGRGGGRTLILVSVAGALALLGLVLVQLRGHPLADLVQPGVNGPAASLVKAEFPGLRLPPGAGNDGQAFYAIARDPLHPTAVAPLLDRPRYRLQRPLYPVLAWLLHPTGGGDALVIALLAVNVAAAGLATAALGWFAARRGRSCAWGLLAVVLPGAYMAMRISCADLLAGGLALLAAALFLDGRSGPAAVVAVAAALTKESTLILTLAVAATGWRRDLRSALRYAAPAVAAAGALWAALLLTFPHAGHQYAELGAPLRGLADSARYWRDTHDWKPAVTVVATFGLAVTAATRRSPLAAATAAYLVVLLLQSMVTIAFWTSAPRTLYPLGLCAVAGLLASERVASVSAPQPALA